MVLGTLVFVALVACGGSTAPSSSGAGLLSDPCGYLTTSDFKASIGLSLAGYRAGQSCSYRDQRGNTCQVTVAADASLYAASKNAAGSYGLVETIPAGDRGFYSSQPQAPGVWIFDFGFMKDGAFAGVVCGARFGTSDPKPQAERLAGLIASRI